MRIGSQNIDVFELIVVVCLGVWAIGALTEIYRGTAKVDGCGCIVHIDKPPIDGGVP